MKVNKIIQKTLYNSKIFKKSMEFASDNGALFAASTTLILSTVVRPLSILVTPNTDKEDKKTICKKSLISSMTGYFLMLAFSRPVSKSLKQITNNPTKYLLNSTINNLKISKELLQNSKPYIFATQLLKLGLGVILAAPKAILTTCILPLFIKKDSEKEKKSAVSFKGNLTKNISKIINNKKFQDFSKKYQDTNFPMHITALTDTITTGTFVAITENKKQLSEKQKKALITNSLIATGLSILSGYFTDKLLDKPTEKFIENFKKYNKDYKNLDKCVEGIKIAKPILIMGGIYYMLIPVISTFFTDKFGQKNTSI